MKIKKVIKVRRFKCGYEVRREIVDGEGSGGEDTEWSAAYTPSGDYIGTPLDAQRLVAKRGIAPQTRTNMSGVCSIGYSSKDGKWYGWSHRAIFGFGIGSKVKKGDCSYTPTDMEDARLDAIRFWTQDSHLNVTATQSEDEDGKACFDVSWTNVDDPVLIPNQKTRGEIGGVRHYPPEQFGNGEWTAETTADAKQMAMDFASGVS